MNIITWIKKAIEAFKRLDALFTIVETTFRKHWILILVILFGLLVWWAFTLPPTEVPKDQAISPDTTQYQETDTTYDEIH